MGMSARAKIVKKAKVAEVIEKPKIVLLDWDGTLVCDQKGEFGNEVLMPEAYSAIRILRRNGWNLAIVTNQPGASERRITEIEIVSSRLFNIGIKVFCCRHRREDGCGCRKPMHKLLTNAINYFCYDFQFESAWIVGDKWSDVLAAERSSVFYSGRVKACKVGDFGYHQKGTTPLPGNLPVPDLFVKDIGVFASIAISGVI